MIILLRLIKKTWIPGFNFVYLRKIKVMRDMYEFTRDAVKSFMEKPFDAIVSFLFIALVFFMLYFSLWVFCPC